MTEQIATLIDKVKEEQKQIRLNELSIIRAQINPHFLYNTLDAVSALALIKDSEGAYTLTQALENFYRISLSSGKDVITVREELKCIENYVKILNIRYKDSFDVNYFVDENITNEKILKLLLQPFVENSIAHGVHNKRGRGIITIKGRKSNDLMIFSIEDNGVGMSKEKSKKS
jgi:Histidine kinase-, DNA gyrase B-, and HSP90-like ATPase./Histidine kinase.